MRFRCHRRPERVASSDVRVRFISLHRANVGDNYSLYCLLLSVSTSFPISRSSQPPLGSLASAHPPTTKSRPLGRSLPASTETSSATLQRINETQYENELDIVRYFKRLHGGHAAYINYCYDGTMPPLTPFSTHI